MNAYYHSFDKNAAFEIVVEAKTKSVLQYLMLGDTNIGLTSNFYL